MRGGYVECEEGHGCEDRHKQQLSRENQDLLHVSKSHVEVSANLPADSFPTTKVRGTVRCAAGAVKAALALTKKLFKDSLEDMLKQTVNPRL